MWYESFTAFWQKSFGSLLGLVVGVAALFAGANFRINRRGNANPGLGFVWFFTGPACGVISGIAASACLANGTSFEDRMRICGGRRPACVSHAVMLTCAAVSLVLSLSPGTGNRLG